MNGNLRRTGLIALAGAIAGSIFLPLARLVALPLHQAGHWQSLLSVVNGAAYLLHVPCSIARMTSSQLLESVGVRSGWIADYVPQVGYLAMNFALCFLATAALHRICRWLRPMNSGLGETPPEAQPAAPQVLAPRPQAALQGSSRREFLRFGAGGLATVGLGAVSYSFLVQTRWFTVRRLTVPVRGLSPALAGMRIAQLTDIHLGPWLSVAHVRHIVDATNRLEADLVLLTGDYVHDSPQYITPVVSALSRLRAKIGVVGVLGNHDWWEDGPHTKREFARHGIPLVDNGRMFVSSGRRLVRDADDGLCIAGVGDLWEDEQHYDAALGQLPGTMPRLLMSHNPDVAEVEDLGRYRVDLMLSGHTHGGQILLPGINPVAGVSRYGGKYTHGLVKGPWCDVYISAGLGMVGLPLRIGTTPEITLIELAAAPKAT